MSDRILALVVFTPLVFGSLVVMAWLFGFEVAVLLSLSVIAVLSMDDRR